MADDLFLQMLKHPLVADIAGHSLVSAGVFGVFCVWSEGGSSAKGRRRGPSFAGWLASGFWLFGLLATLVTGGRIAGTLLGFASLPLVAAVWLAYVPETPDDPEPPPTPAPEPDERGWDEPV